MKSRGISVGGLVCAAFVVFAAALLYSCGGGGGAGESGTVALYATDEPSLNSEVTSTIGGNGSVDSSLDSEVTTTVNGIRNGDLSLFSQVTATINRIVIVSTGRGTACEVLAEPAPLDLADLSDVMHLISMTECPAASYNRIRVEFDKSIQLTDAEENESSCSFTSYKDKDNRPNVLQCNGETCTLEITGAVNVLMNQNNQMTLNFNLKEFDVTGTGDPEACSVTLKVSPIHGSQIEMPGHSESITGLVSNLSTSDQTFDLMRGRRTFEILYSGITSSQQPGIDELLEQAQDERLRVKVMSSQINVAGGAIEASALFVKIEGVVSDADEENQTFTLTYKGGATIEIDYAGAVAEGAPADGDWVELKLSGYDGEWYLAVEVKAGSEGNTTDN